MKDGLTTIADVSKCAALSDSSFILPPSSLRHFAVTTPGLTATRWLSHVLASHPDVYVAHGKFVLDSIKRGGIFEEQATASNESLMRGNETRDFYDSRPLEEVFSLYRGLTPTARALGCVHAYTLHTLMRSARRAETLDQMTIVNVVRHPVEWIASHYALVRSSEQHPRLYRQYLDEVFPQALAEFPELFLVKCPDYRAFSAFAISCRGVSQLLFDMCYPGIRQVQMEILTTQSAALREFCEEVTGLRYAPESLVEFVSAGAINRHRERSSRRDPVETYASWQPWQRDMAHMMIPGLVLDWLEELGYDLGMLRNPAPSPASEASAPCLADFPSSVDQKHPLLAYKIKAGRSYTQTIESDLHGFRCVRRDEDFLAVAKSAGASDSSRLDAMAFKELENGGWYLTGRSMGEIWLKIGERLAGPTPWSVRRSLEEKESA